MAHPSTFAAGRRTGGERAGAAARHVPGQRLARVGSASIFGRIEGIAVCVGVSQTGHTARLVQNDLRMHFVHETREDGHLQLHKIDSKLNGADILTKASTSPDVFADLRRRIMGHNS